MTAHTWGLVANFGWTALFIWLLMLMFIPAAIALYNLLSDRRPLREIGGLREWCRQSWRTLTWRLWR